MSINEMHIISGLAIDYMVRLLFIVKYIIRLEPRFVVISIIKIINMINIFISALASSTQ